MATKGLKLIESYEDFQEVIKANRALVIVSKEGCSACKTLAPEAEKFAKVCGDRLAIRGIVMESGDERPEWKEKLAEEYRISYLPTTLIFVAGELHSANWSSRSAYTAFYAELRAVTSRGELAEALFQSMKSRLGFQD